MKFPWSGDEPFCITQLNNPPTKLGGFLVFTNILSVSPTTEPNHITPKGYFHSFLLSI